VHPNTDSNNPTSNNNRPPAMACKYGCGRTFEIESKIVRRAGVGRNLVRGVSPSSGVRGSASDG
jgi:hypothetical protein